MLQNISNLGNTLAKKEQKEITGGRFDSIDDGASFPCYCNGVLEGNASTVQECLDMCC